MTRRVFRASGNWARTAERAATGIPRSGSCDAGSRAPFTSSGNAFNPGAQALGMAGELDGAYGALEALGVGEHIDVGEDVGGVLVAAGEGDLSEPLDRRVLVA